MSTAWSQTSKGDPNVVGLQLDKAIEILEKQGYEVLAHPYSTIYPSRDKKVLAQRIGSNGGSSRSGASSKYLSSGSAKQGRQAEIWYYDINTRERTPLPEKPEQAKSQAANAVNLVTVPSLIGLSIERAELSLNDLGLGVIVSDRRITANPFKERTIADQYPRPGARVAPDSLVSITVYFYRDQSRIREKLDEGLNPTN